MKEARDTVDGFMFVFFFVFCSFKINKNLARLALLKVKICPVPQIILTEIRKGGDDTGIGVILFLEVQRLAVVLLSGS